MSKSAQRGSKVHGIVLPIALVAMIGASIAACGSDDSGGNPAATGGSGGVATGGSAGQGGAGGMGGSAGSGGVAGGATGGAAGSTAGTGGSAAGAGGTAGTGGGGGTAGGAGTGGSGGGIPYNCEKFVSVTADAACTSYATSTCNLLKTCIPVFFMYSSDSVCADRMKMGCLDALTAPGSNAKAARYAAVAEAISGMNCEQYWGSMNAGGQIVGDPAACGGSGTVADGKQCYVDEQCASDKCSDKSGTACGVCAGKVGAACDYSTGCADGAYCDTQSSKCKAKNAAGGACTTSQQCADALYCDSQTNVCAASKAEGVACADSSQCSSGLCGLSGTCKKPSLGALGATCDQENMSCNSYLGLECQNGTCAKGESLQPGSACGVFNEDGGVVWKIFCLGGSSCGIPTGQQQGTCVLNANDGAACDSSQGPDCSQPAECVNNVCVVPSATVCPLN